MLRLLPVFTLVCCLSLAARAQHADTTRPTRPMADPGPGDPKAIALKLTPVQREVCDLERAIQQLGPHIFSSYGQPGFPTEEGWRKKAALLREVVPVLESVPREDLEAFPSIREGYGPAPVVGPSVTGDIALGSMADPKEVARQLKPALDRRRFERDRMEMYRVINQIAAGTGILVEPNVGDLAQQTAVLEQLQPYLRKQPPDSALAQIHISSQPSESLNFSGNRLTIYLKQGDSRIEPAKLDKLFASIPKSEHALIAAKLAELEGQLTAKENKDKIGKLAAEYQRDDPGQLKKKLIETIAKTPIAPRPPFGRDPERDAKLRALALKFGKDVQIRNPNGAAGDRQIAMLEKLAEKGYRLKAPSRTILLGARGYGIKATEGGKWFPTLGGDCLPWAVFDPNATEAQVAAFFDPPARH